MQGPVGFCIHNASQLQVAATGLSVVHWQGLGQWSVDYWGANTPLTHTRINIVSPSACSHTHAHGHTHKAFALSTNGPLHVMQSGSMQSLRLHHITSERPLQRVFLLSFLRLLLIRTQRWTGQSCSTARRRLPRRSTVHLRRGESCSAAHT